jgi:hypothetical protein
VLLIISTGITHYSGSASAQITRLLSISPSKRRGAQRSVRLGHSGAFASRISSLPSVRFEHLISSSKRTLRCAPSERNHEANPSLRSATLRGQDGKYFAGQDIWLCYRRVTILRARRKRKVYGWYEQVDFLDQSRARIRSSFTVMVMVTAD